MTTRITLLLLTAFFAITGCQQDPCEAVACQNGGTCQEGVCNCPEGFEGDNCEVFDGLQFLGTYSGNYAGCFDVPAEHRVIIEQVPGEAAKIRLYNLGDYACPGGELVVEAEIASNQVTIPEQNVDCGVITYTIRGEGAFEAGKISLGFSNTYDAGGFEQVDSCTVTLEKL